MKISPAQVLAADSLVHCGTTPDSLPVVVGNIGPPVSLLLHIAQNHVLNWGRKARHLPGDVCLHQENVNTQPFSVPSHMPDFSCLISFHLIRFFLEKYNINDLQQELAGSSFNRKKNRKGG